MSNTNLETSLVLPPEGYVPDSESLYDETVTIHAFMLFATTTCIGIRLYTRRVITQQLSLDDYLCMLGYVGIITYAGLVIKASEYHSGRHIWDVSGENLLMGRRMDFPIRIMYMITASTIRLSCLALYNRIFNPSRKTRYFIYGGVVFVSVGLVSMLLATFLYCDPLSKNWNYSIPGHCGPRGILAFVGGAINVTGDLIILILPMPVVWRLNMKTSRRIKTMAVFGLGLFAVAMSITRLASSPLLRLVDETWWTGQFAIYSALELYIGMICACSLSFPVFLDRYGPRFNNYIRSFLIRPGRVNRLHDPQITPSCDDRKSDVELKLKTLIKPP